MNRVMKLLFIRHAQSVGNQERRMQGHGDFALSKVGEQQAEKLARRLLKSGPPSHVYSSPLKRAAQTTQILMEHFLVAPLPAAVSDLIGVEESAVDELPDDDLSDEPKTIPVHYADETKEFQNGIFQGLTWTEARICYPQLCRKLEASPDWIQIPEAESLHDARSGEGICKGTVGTPQKRGPHLDCHP